jgi:hypothetical protein
MEEEVLTEVWEAEVEEVLVEEAEVEVWEAEVEVGVVEAVAADAK